MKKKPLVYAKTTVFLYFLILVLVQMPWFVVNGNSKNIYQMYRLVRTEGLAGFSEDAVMQIQSVFRGDTGMLSKVFLLELAVIIIFQILCIVYAASVLCGKRWRINIVLLILVYAIQKINDTGFGMVSENVVAGFAPLIWELSVLQNLFCRNCCMGGRVLRK